MVGPLEPELLEATAQCARIDAELFSGALRSVNSPVRLVQHTEHMSAFNVLEIDGRALLQTRLGQGQELRIDGDDGRRG